MNSHSKIRCLGLGALALGMFAITDVNTASAQPGGKSTLGYNAIPSELPGNVVSHGFECCGTTEFGDEVLLGGPERKLQSMSVVFSSWGCEDGAWNTNDCVTTHNATFPVTLTFTIYKVDNKIRGAVLASQTQVVDVLYRPSASEECTGSDAGKWYDEQDDTCYNGFAQIIKMTFPKGITLDQDVIWAVSFNTTHGGAHPIGEGADCFNESGGCGYDSLNVGLFSALNPPYAGTDVDGSEVFRNGVIQSDWTFGRPLGAILTKK